MISRAILLLIILLPTSGCSAAVWEGVAAGLQGVAQGAAAANYSGSTKLMLFGGPNHKTYLGCLNCNEFASDSVFNSYGSYGSSYSTTSVLNAYSQFGSKFSPYGACNQFASDPPVIVDQNGNFYGRLTLNASHRQRTRDGSLLAWLAGVCAS